jgi:uncharacterized delta-60 repeat protein
LSSLLPRWFRRPSRRPRKVVPPVARPKLERLEGRELLSAGDLDPTFGVGGKVLSGNFLGSQDDVPHALVRQPDGKVVAAGTSFASGRSSVSLVRYNADGSLDATFGSGGQVVTTLAGPRVSVGQVAVQPDGKIVVAGSIGGAAADDFLLGRFNADGSPDATFGIGGRVTTDFDGRTDQGEGVVVQPDGKLIVAGSSSVLDSTRIPTDPRAVLVRYNADGSLDASFAVGGKLTVAGAALTGAQDVAVQADGKIVAVGSQQSNFAVWRFNVDGSPDAGFGEQGVARADVRVDGGDFAEGVAVQPDGRIVVVGTTVFSPPRMPGPTFGVALARFTAAGRPDTTFDGDGVTADPALFAGLSGDPTVGLAVQADGSVVVARQLPRSLTLARFTAAGARDMTFGTDGLAVTKIGGERMNAPRSARASVVDVGGRLISYAAAPGAGGNDFGLAAFTAAGSPDAGFGTGGQVQTDLLGPVGAKAFAVARQADGKLVVAGAVTSSSGVSSYAVFRYNADGSLDTSFGDGGVVRRDLEPGFVSIAQAVVVQPDGKIVVGGNGFLKGIVTRYHPDGSPDATFGVGGTVDLPDQQQRTLALALLPDGDILVGSGSTLRRLNPDGGTDRDFDTTGYQVTGVAVQPDGKVLAVGTEFQFFGPAYLVVRYNLDGTRDASFGVNGVARVVVANIQDSIAHGVALQADGRIVVGGQAADALAAGRLLPDGSVDPGFGSLGRAETEAGGSGTAPSQGFLDVVGVGSVAVQPNGLIVVAGSPRPGDFVLVTLHPDGSLDTEFGDNGVVRTDFGGGPDVARGLLLQPDGKIVVVGLASVDGVPYVGMARYEADVRPDPRATDDAVRFVTALYNDLLGRGPDAGGLGFWTDRLRQARQQALQAGASSLVVLGERRAALIADFYTRLLGRPASAEDVRAWQEVAARSGGADAILLGVVGSPEYFNAAGGTDTGWADRVTRDLLGRDRDPADTRLLDLLAQGRSRAEAATTFLADPEYQRGLIRDAYRDLLGREPGADEVEVWLGFLSQPAAAGTSPGEQLLAAVAASAESFAWHGNSVQSWLDGVRADFGLSPNAASYQASLLELYDDYQDARRQVAEGFVASEEYRRVWVADAYRDLLRREAGPAELDLWTGVFRGGATEEQVLAVVYASDEYFQRAGRDTANWLNFALYGDALGRPGGLDTQPILNALTAGRATRLDVAAAVLGSDEARRRLVPADYLTFLDREASVADGAFWLGQLNQGRRHELFVADLLSSAEYLLQTGQAR